MTAGGYRSWVEISRERIAENFRAVRELVGPQVEVAPVVKADAYGHGAIEVSRVLESAGARWLAVSGVEEGVALRRAGIRTRILVMADFLESEREALFEFNLTPAIHSLEDLSTLDRMAAERRRPLAFHLKLDTGMGRLGTLAGPEEILAALQAVREARFEGLMTHFASAAHYGSGQTERQIEAFDRVLTTLEAAGLAPRYQHMGSTIVVAYARREAWRNMVRPGQAIYGYISPVRGTTRKPVLRVEPAMQWKATFLEIKQVPEGMLIGYGGMFRAPRPMRIGILAVGYADGYPHRLSNRGRVIVKGRYAPVVGAVSMDLTTVDVTGIDGVGPGDCATLLGVEGQASIDAQEIARLAGTISYAVLCGISGRVRRVYL
jgi:alanine racemase